MITDIGQWLYEPTELDLKLVLLVPADYHNFVEDRAFQGTSVCRGCGYWVMTSHIISNA
jgi:hypothetical protein